MFVNTQTNTFLQHSCHTLLCQGQFLTVELLNMITSIEMLTNKTMTLHLHVLFFLQKDHGNLGKKVQVILLHVMVKNIIKRACCKKMILSTHSVSMHTNNCVITVQVVATRKKKCSKT